MTIAGQGQAGPHQGSHLNDNYDRDGAAFVRMKDAMTEWLQMFISSETAIEMVRDEVLDILISATTEEER